MIQTEESPWGTKIYFGNKTLIFGNRRLTWEHLTSSLKSPVFKLKQIHSDILHTQPGSPDFEGDAHWSDSTAPLALSVYTADCVPVFLAHPEEPFVAAFHCGWRGVAENLLAKGLEKMALEPTLLRDALAFIGPHISFENFEVGEDVGKRILSALPPKAASAKHHRPASKGKWLVDLGGVVLDQVLSHGLKVGYASRHNTYTSQNYHSYRRDGAKAQRQWSSILNHRDPLKFSPSDQEVELKD